MTSNIPANAIRITYNYGGGSTGAFHVWQCRGSWYWDALGACGEENTEDKAVQSARNWIRFNQIKKEN